MLKFLLLIFSISLLFAQKIPPPAHLQALNCHPDYPFQSFGDLIITDNNYTSTISNNKFIMAIASAGWCKACCKHEEFFYNLKQRYLSNKNINPYADEIKIARIDFSIPESSEINNQFKLLRIPYLIFYKEGVPYLYNDILDYSKIVRFINRIKQPLVKVKTLEQVEHFLNREEKDFDQNSLNPLKIVGFFYDPEETVEDIREFERAAHMLLSRTEVYLCMITNQTEIKKAKKKYENQWFEDYTLTSVVIQHYPGKFSIIDISELVLGLKRLSDTINAKALKLIDEINVDTFKFYDEKQKPLLIFILDAFVNVDTSRKILRMAEEVAKEFVGKIFFAWADGNLNSKRKELLGIEHNRMPAMAFFRIDFENKISFPSDWPINKDTIREFINDYMTMPLINMIEKYERNQKKLKKSAIYSYLKKVQDLNEEKFEMYRQEDCDLVVLFIHSRKHLDQTNLALNYNQISKRFSDFLIDSVKVTLFDTFYSSKPEIISENYEKPFIVYFPKGVDREKYIPYEGELKAEKMMNFVAENSNGRINLPEFPHISEDLIDQYLNDQANMGEDFSEEKYLKYKDEL